MPDREKVIKGLKKLHGTSETMTLIAETITLLEEQEAVEPKEIVNEHFSIGDYRRTIGWLCGKCGRALMGDGNYCSYCGQAVKWDENP